MAADGLTKLLPRAKDEAFPDLTRQNTRQNTNQQQGQQYIQQGSHQTQTQQVRFQLDDRPHAKHEGENNGVAIAGYLSDSGGLEELEQLELNDRMAWCDSCWTTANGKACRIVYIDLTRCNLWHRPRLDLTLPVHL